MVTGARLSCLFQAWQMISIADVQSIINASPVLVMILSHIIIDDRMTLIKSLCCIGYLVGVLCIFQLLQSLLIGSMVLDSIGYLLALVALVLSSLGTIFNKVMTGSFPKYVILCYLGIGISTAAMLQLQLLPSLDVPIFPDNLSIWLQAGLIAFFGTLQQFLIVWALSLESASKVAMMRSITILFSFFVAFLKGENFNLEQIAGASLIIISMIVHANESWITSKCPKLDMTFPSCRNIQVGYSIVSGENHESEDLETHKPTKK